jgi:nanoRNase/pAp phosphatase (c-di-AMP/oligoRNAs hydrolase)
MSNMNFTELSSRLVEVLRRYGDILIIVKGSPDPDVLASSFALKVICSSFGVKAAIIALTEISLPQNQAIVDVCDIPVRFMKSLPSPDDYRAYAVMDFQSAAVKGLAALPCAVHIDHHEKIKEDIRVDFELVTEEAGSASTLMALMLKHLNLPLAGELGTRVATALLFGVQTDTSGLRYAARMDYEALEYLYLRADKNVIQKITDLPLSEELVTLIARAMINREVYKDWSISGIGFIDESQRDNIALVADYLLQREKEDTVVVFAVIVRNNSRSLTLDASFRTRDKNLNLNDLIREITTEGGARRYKGAYQINLDYFASFPDRKLLWDVIRTTTLEIIRKNRDKMPIIGLRGFYRKVKNRLSDLLG